MSCGDLLLAVSSVSRALDSVPSSPGSSGCPSRCGWTRLRSWRRVTLLLSAVAVAAPGGYFAPLLLRCSYLCLDRCCRRRWLLLSQLRLRFNNHYRQVFSAVVIFSVAIWYPVIEARAERASRSTGALLPAGCRRRPAWPLRCSISRIALLYFNKSVRGSELEQHPTVTQLVNAETTSAVLSGLSLLRELARSRSDARCIRLGVQESLFSRFRKRRQSIVDCKVNDSE